MHELIADTLELVADDIDVTTARAWVAGVLAVVK
jgi:hypothetical protein